MNYDEQYYDVCFFSLLLRSISQDATLTYCREGENIMSIYKKEDDDRFGPEEFINEILSLDEKNRIELAYIYYGVHGSGKTLMYSVLEKAAKKYEDKLIYIGISFNDRAVYEDFISFCKGKIILSSLANFLRYYIAKQFNPRLYNDSKFSEKIIEKLKEKKKKIIISIDGLDVLSIRLLKHQLIDEVMDIITEFYRCVRDINFDLIDKRRGLIIFFNRTELHKRINAINHNIYDDFDAEIGIRGSVKKRTTDFLDLYKFFLKQQNTHITSSINENKSFSGIDPRQCRYSKNCPFKIFNYLRKNEDEFNDFFDRYNKIKKTIKAFNKNNGC